MQAKSSTVPAEPYPFELRPAECGLLIIDMQRDFLEPGGFGEMLGNDVSQLRRTIEPNRRLLSAWREAPCYTERERAALDWTEALTRLSEGHPDESAYGALKAQFSDEDQVKLTLMINIINGWNRLSVGFGTWMEPAAAKAAARAAA